MSRVALAVVVGTSLSMSLSMSLLGCEEQPKPEKTAASRTPAAPPQPTAAPKPTAVASAAPPLKDRDDCPEGSTGPGTFDKPCEGGQGSHDGGDVDGKLTDTGPSFRVVNKSKLGILYGRLAAYFYDKAGKQLEANDTSESPPKKRPQQWCSGKIFDGPMKPGEKAVITFSCVKKDNVPEGTAAIEAELQVVGFMDEEGKKTEYYWRNEELTPDQRRWRKVALGATLSGRALS
jgi:hypothetical protein